MDIKRLNLLADKIKYNSATQKEFNEYVTLIEEGGYTEHHIGTKLKENGFESWRNLKNAREALHQNSPIKEKRLLEVEILSFILAYQFAIIIDV